MLPYSLDALSLLRARLQALKRDTEEFVKAQDVFQLYKETLQQGEWDTSACLPYSAHSSLSLPFRSSSNCPDQLHHPTLTS